ncbi:MAG: DMT family transporter [Actinomycetia bacterium]|nr:DMT family transporter [Actinomycetes bacterium]
MEAEPTSGQDRVWPLFVVLAIAIVAISSSAVLVQWAAASPVALAFWRTAGGAIILAWPSLRLGVRPTATQWPWLGLAGVALGVHFATWLASLELTSVAASVTLVSTAPLIMALHLLATGRNPSRSTWTAIIIAMVGTIIIAGGDLGSGSEAMTGDGLALIGAVMMAVYLSVGQRLRASLATATYASRTYAVAALSLVPIIVMFDIQAWGYDQTTWLAIGGMILGPQLAGHTAFNLLLKRLGSMTVSLALLAEPLGASILVWLFFGQLPPLAAVIGAPLVMAGLVLQVVAGGRTTSEPQTAHP